MNVPNTLSIFRLLLVPVFAVVFFGNGANAQFDAVLIYVIASSTDVLDGLIARKYHLITSLGRILDPLADKLMNFTVIICIAFAGIVPYWAALIFFVTEAVMGIGALLLYKKINDVISANSIGKIATVVFFTVCVILMIFTQIPQSIATLMISVALVVTVAAFINYLRVFIIMIKKSEIVQ